MEPLGLLEESNACHYAMLSTRVSQVLNKLQKSKSVSDQEYQALQRGAALLKQIIEGSILISRKGAIGDFSPSQEGLSAYGHALSAIEKLGTIKKEKDFTELFMRLYNQLITISAKQQAEKGVIPVLVRFFNMLSNFFTADIKKQSFYIMPTPSQLDNYALEIISRARSIRHSCTTLLTHNYSSSAPRDLAETIIRICDYLVDAIVEINRTTEHDDDTIKNVLQIFQITDYCIMKISAHVRYINGARSERLPWSIMLAFQKRIERLLPDVHILLRPQWKYNYSIDPDDLYLVYQKTLSEYQDFVPGKKIDFVLGKLKSPFYLISFPSLERKNIFLHTIIGHEIGHLYAKKYITADKKTSFSQAVIPEIELIVNEEIKPIPELGPLFKKAAKENQKIFYLQEVTRCWKRGLEELLSDVVDAILFGPAALFSCYESAMQQGIDFEPSEDHDYCPPWRMRLQVILRVLDSSKTKLLPIDDTIFGKSKSDKTIRVNQLFDQIKTITAARGDLDLIENNKLWALAHKQIEADLTSGLSFLLEDLKLKNELVTAERLYGKLGHLIERLENSTPPNADESDINNRQPADMVEIINAAWFYKIACTESILKSDESFNDNS